VNFEKSTKEVAVHRLKNTVVLDTNALLFNPNIIEELGQVNIVIPMVVIEELDELKSTGKDAIPVVHAISNFLNEFRRLGDLRKQGVETKSGGRLFVAYASADWSELNGLARGLKRNNDNLILLYVKNWANKHPDQKVILMSGDTNMLIKAAGLGIEVREAAPKVEEEKMDTGIVTIPCQAHDLTSLNVAFDKTKQTKGGISSEKFIPPEVLKNLRWNTCLIFNAAGKTTLAVYRGKSIYRVEKPTVDQNSREYDIKPRNPEQAFSLWLARLKDLSLLTLIGKAGSGKTLLALFAAWEMLKKSEIKEIMVYRPIHEVGQKDLGALPGDMRNKFGPWAVPILDNLELITSMKNVITEIRDDCISLKFEGVGEVNISPIIHIRGRSLHNMFVIVDEAQNMSPSDVRSVITRAGVGTKVVVTGDPTQIDNRLLSSKSNGAIRVARYFQGQDWEKYGHVWLPKSERSELADRAAGIS